jgi:hypothetical protein
MMRSVGISLLTKPAGPISEVDNNCCQARFYCLEYQTTAATNDFVVVAHWCASIKGLGFAPKSFSTRDREHDNSVAVYLQPFCVKSGPSLSGTTLNGAAFYFWLRGPTPIPSAPLVLSWCSAESR